MASTFHRAEQRAAHRSLWLRRVEWEITKLRPELAGKVDWTTASYLFDRGFSSTDAAVRLSAL